MGHGQGRWHETQEAQNDHPHNCVAPQVTFDRNQPQHDQWRYRQQQGGDGQAQPEDIWEQLCERRSLYRDDERGEPADARHDAKQE